jgi:hypothetical protein
MPGADFNAPGFPLTRKYTHGEKHETTADAGDSLGPTNSLEDLLTRIRVHLTTKGDLSRQQLRKRSADFAWAASVIARSLDKPTNRVRLSELVGSEARFRSYLDQRTQATPRRKAVLRWHRNRLIRYAREFGLLHESFQINDEWSQIRAAVRKVQGGPAIVKAAIRRGVDHRSSPRQTSKRGVTNGRGRIALTSTCKWRSLGFARRSAVQAWRDNCPYSTVAAELVRNTGSGSQTSRPSYGTN